MENNIENENIENVEVAENVEVVEAVETPVEQNNENVVANDNSREQRKGKFNKNGKKPFGDRKRREGRQRDEFDKRTVLINRVSKSVKGGKILNFSALVVVGDKNGRVGVGSGKSRETTEAIERATKNAKKNLVKVSMLGTTIPHATEGKFGKSKVLLFPSKEGNGIIAGGAARAVLELAGYRDITAKLHGSTNKANCVKATLQALMTLKTKEEVFANRGIIENKEAIDGNN